MDQQVPEERRKSFEWFKEKAIDKARRDKLKVQFPDGSEYDFREKNIDKVST